MPMYREVVAAAGDTATAIVRQRTGATRMIRVTMEGGSTANVRWSDDQYEPVVLSLPTLPPDVFMTRAEADRIVGYVAHECCHVVHTSWSTWQRAVSAGPDVQGLVNCLEDVRIEAAEIAAGHYPGLKGLLASVLTMKHAEALTKATSEGLTIGSKMAHVGYVCCVIGRMRNGYVVPTAHGLEAGLSPNVRALVNWGLARLPRCANTEDVLKLALAMLAKAKHDANKPKPTPEPEPEPEPTPEPTDGEDGEDGENAPGEPTDGEDGENAPGEPTDGEDGENAPGEPTDGEDGENAPGEPTDGENAPGEPTDGKDGENAPGEPTEGEGEGESAPGEPTEGEGEGEGENAPGEPTEGEGEGEGENAPGAGSDQGTAEAGEPDDDDDAGEPIDPDDLQTMLEKIAERHGEEALTEASESLAHLLPLVRVRTFPPYVGYPAENKTHAMALNRALPTAGVLHGQIARMLVSEEKFRRTHHETSGRLDRRALARMRTGAPDVFTRREDTPAVQTALVLLVDGSGSMHLFDRYMMARAATWAIAKAADDAGAKLRIMNFDSPDSAGHTTARLRVVKDWDTPLTTAASAVGSMSYDGGTPLSPAILAAADMLGEVNATRRIIMCLTDGVCNFRPAAVTIACRMAAAQGVEVVGIGMQCDTIAQAFPPRYSTNVENLAQLAATGLGTLVRMLEDADRAGAPGLPFTQRREHHDPP